MTGLCALLCFFSVTAGLAAADDTLRVGMIPDAGTTQVSVEKKSPLQAYLHKFLGQPVVLIIPTNYNATVEALGNDSLDFAYLGGLTYIKARQLYGVVPLVQRDSDQHFHSLFITQTHSNIRSLKDLKEKRFAFGDINSTSGHLMPYMALRQAGIDPDRDLIYHYTGNHAATAKAVESGAVDAGALDETVFHQMLAERQLNPTSVRVFYTTTSFVDYVWVSRKSMGQAAQVRFARAFLTLSGPRDAEVLDILRAAHFVRASDSEYDSLRDAARDAGLFK